MQEVSMKNIQNITLAIPKELLRKAKILAIRKNTSLSGLLTETLSELVARQEDYEQARWRNLEILKNGLDLGTQGNITWEREELHERRPRK
jgi:hypothetical protein